MNIPDNILKNRLKNVYFIWGRGKTTIAKKLQEKYGYYVYSTDDSRYDHLLEADMENQPYMCWDVEKEYGVRNFWELPKKVILEREEYFLKEMTPMIIADLIELSAQHEVIICEGDIDYCSVIPIASHVVYLCNQGEIFDWFKRSDHDDIEVSLKYRDDLNDEEKQAIITNAYECVMENEGIKPEWVKKFQIQNIEWDDNTSVEQTLNEVEVYFNLKRE